MSLNSFNDHDLYGADDEVGVPPSPEPEIPISNPSYDEEMIEEPTSSSTSGLLPKSHTKSAAWQYFGLKSKDGKVIDDEQVFCKICNRGIMAKNGNTSNLMAYLCNNHKCAFSQIRTSPRPSTNKKQATTHDQQQPTIDSSFLHSQPYSHNSKKCKVLTNSITRFIVKDELPIYSVQKKGFKQMIAKFDSRHQIPDPFYFSRTAIPDLYNTIKKK